MEKSLTLRDLRERRGLQQKELATLAGTTQPQLSHIETGARACDTDLAARLSPHLQMSIEDVLAASRASMSARLSDTIRSITQLRQQLVEATRGPVRPNDDVEIQKIQMVLGTLERERERLHRDISGAALSPEKEAVLWVMKRHVDLKPANVELRPDDQIPVHSIAKAGPGQPMFLEDGPIEWTDRPGFLSRVQDAYAVYVSGDSMYPRYRSGQVLYVHPHRPPAAGTGVVVVTMGNDVLIKEWVREDLASIFLKEYRPREREFDLPRSDIASVHAVVGLKEA